MNETSVCDHLLESVKWTEPGRLVSLAVLEFINVLVIVGNCLVIAAVFCSNKLRSVTNYFIVNLAVADLLVGLAVLPFSATWEVYKVWIFGDVWCRVWLAVDVWMCTASILNLCAISLDRYVAVTRPVTYPSIMSTKKAKSLIAGIWVLSFVICFPPLVGWKDQKILMIAPFCNHIIIHLNFRVLLIEPEQMIPDAEFYGTFLLIEFQTSIYSLPLSFIKQSTVIEFFIFDFLCPYLFFMYIINFQPDSNDVYYSRGNVTLYFATSEPPILLPTPVPCPWKCELTNDRGYVLYSALGSFYIPMFVMLFFYWRIYRAAVRTTRAINQGFKTTKGSKGIGNRFDEQRLTLRIHRGRGSSNQHDSLHSNGSTHSTTTTIGTPSPERLSRYATRKHEKIKISVSYPSSENVHDLSQTNAPTNVLYSVHYTSPNGKDTTASQLFRHTSKDGYLQVAGTTKPGDGNKTSNSPRPSKKMGKRNIKAQVKRFRMETKAAKTLAIIVGLFILCWLPFFTMYVIRGFCEECIDPLVFSVLFWLGYCNSAVNPMIYALFSKDFRFAFKRVICRCFCSNQRLSQKTSRRGSDMSQIRHAGARTPSISPSAAAHSLGDESDNLCEMSDSR